MPKRRAALRILCLLTVLWPLAGRAAEYEYADGAVDANVEPAELAVAPERLAGLIAGAFYRRPDTEVRLPEDDAPIARHLVLPDSVEDVWTTLAYGVVFAGGYEKARAERLFGTVDPVARQGQRLLARFDAEMEAQKQSRDALRLAPGIAAMVPPAAVDHPENTDPRDGLYAHVVTLSALYARQPEDGLAAAGHLAFLTSDDAKSEACARAAFALLAHVLTAPSINRDESVRAAAEAAADDDVARALLAARVKPARMLRDEATQLGRLERVVHLWYATAPRPAAAAPEHGPGLAGFGPSAAPEASVDDNGIQDRARAAGLLLREGLGLVQHWDARFFLFALAGASYGIDALPAALRAQHRRSREQQRLFEEWSGFQDNLEFLPVAPETSPSPEAGRRTPTTKYAPRRFLIGGRLFFW